MHDRSSFVTLTYAPENLPPNGSLEYPTFQRFMKRLRKVYGPTRFFMCGEYGEARKRPHYHAGFFGLWPDDAKQWRKSASGFPLFRSAKLEALWPLGSVEFGLLTFESAAYMARYVMGKVTGDQAEDYYRGVNTQSGEIEPVEPEFCHMSTKPGIGAMWFDRFHSEMFVHDKVYTNGVLARAPRYYDKLRKRMDAEGLELAKEERARKAAAGAADQTDERLAVREEVTKARVRFLKREL